MSSGDRSTRRWGSYLLAATLVAGLISPAGEARGAQAEENDTTVLKSNDRVEITRTGDWLYRTFRDPLPDAFTVEYKGTPVRGGECSYSFSSVSSGDTDHEYFRIYREIAQNPVTCTTRYEVADLPMERLAEFDQTAGLEIETQSFTPVVGETKDPLLAGATDEDGLTAMASSSYSAWYRTAWEDPFQIDVNTVTVYLNWTSNGSCVTASSNHKGEWAWFTASGWFLVSKSGSGGRTCNNAYTKATGSFGNWAWNDDNKYTWTKHTDTTIRGFATGSIGIANNMTKGGEDSSLLFKDFVCSWKNC